MEILPIVLKIMRMLLASNYAENYAGIMCVSLLPSPPSLRLPPQVKTELTLTAMTTNGKLLAEKAIEGVKERGHTNLSGGLLAALEVLYRYILPHVPALSSP